MNRFFREMMDGSRGGGGFRKIEANTIKEIISSKNEEYLHNAKLYRLLYYLIRFTIGISAAVIPFLINTYQLFASILSFLIVISTVIDIILNPKDRWTIYSKANDLITVAILKKETDYAENIEILEIILKTESSQFDKLIDIETLNKIVTDLQAKK